MDEQTLSDGKDTKIQENIFDIKEPFVLKVKDAKKRRNKKLLIVKLRSKQAQRFYRTA